MTCLHHLFEAQVVRTPHALAVSADTACLAYEELNARANRLAHFLRAEGVGPEVIVGVCLDASPHVPVALLAILKAGGAYLPLDPAYPAERLAFMLSDAAVRLVLTDRASGASLPPSYNGDTLCLDGDSARRHSQSSDNPIGGARPDSLAYVIYTSGSTGRPKGVLLEHAGAVNNLRWRQERFPLGIGDRMLQTYSLNFDPSVWAIFWPLASGAALILPRPGGIAEPGYLVQTLADERITVAGFGPAMLGAMLAHPGITGCRSLRHVFCGGEAMPPDLPRRFHALLDADLHNVYGPTEATIDAACYTVPRGFTGESVPLGRALPNTWLVVPDGVEGEMSISGISLARGYLNRPDLTAERFPTDAGGTRTYRTGDLVRVGPDGELYFRGRADDQIQLRGIRIEPGEIEAALSRHPEVSDAAAALYGDRLVAYVVPTPGAAPTPAEMRRFLSDTLPPAWVPATFVLLDALPLTPSGKRDRAALPRPGPEAQERGADVPPPQDDLQRRLVQIWEDLLGVHPVGIRDRFRDLGGHSLLAAQMLDRVSQACGRTVPLSALYEADTIERLAETLRSEVSETAGSPPTRIVGGTRRPFFFLYGYHPFGGFYCHPLARRLPPGQPFYAVHPPPLPSGRITVEGMAAASLEAVQAVQPHGPYRMGGFCGSGLVAYEMARMLAEQGQTVELLALVEVQTVNARLRLLLRRLANGPAAFLGLQTLLLPPLVALQSGWRRRGSRGRTSDPARIADCDQAVGAHVPRPYAGPVTLIRAADDPLTYPGDPTRLWREIAPHLSVVDVRGTHLGCLEEDVVGLGDGLGAVLEGLERP